MRSPEAVVSAELVAAAQGGDHDALQRLIADHLDMLYNIVGRALDGHADTDDVVQETLLRVVQNIRSLRDPARFSGWLLAIAHRQIAERMRRRQTATDRTSTLNPLLQIADPAADFAELTILRLGLSGQRRQAVEATRWLDPDDRFLLSLWWLEVTGIISRADVVTALDGTPGYAAVRIKRMRDQLQLSRHIVSALEAEPRCPGLPEIVDTWDGEPSPVWRKRLARHLRDCRLCSTHGRRLVSPEALLAGLAMLPLPTSMAAYGTSAASVTITAAGAVLPTAAPHGGGWFGASALTKITAAAISAAVVSGATIAVVYNHRTPRPKALPTVVTTSAAAPRTSPSAMAKSPSSSPSAIPTALPRLRYGSVVDAVDAAPPKNRRPGKLPSRPQGALAVTASNDEDPRPDVVSLVRRGQSVTYHGRGYLRVEYSFPYTQRTGVVAMPAWTGLQGKLFHVASGGGQRLDDQIPNAATGTTGMGDSTHGYDTLPAGTQQMWRFEYYYLDGEVTLHSNERGADYNLYVHIVDRASIDHDLQSRPGVAGTPIRYGLDRDSGDDSTPVPQYVTRANPADPATVAQHSRV